jgi:arylsulfatase A-like enzyme
LIRVLPAVALAAVLAWPATASPPEAARRANVIILSLDTLRADRLGCYGYDRPTSPALDALAERSVRFDRVFAETSWTLPSHMTLFTGRHPTSHGVIDTQYQLAEHIPTFAQVLQDDGYRTFAVTDGGYVDSFFGFGRGFDRYDEREKDFQSTLYLARNFLRTIKPGERFFLFLHTYDIHCPYDPPEQYARMFRTRPPEDHLDVAGKCGNPDFNELDLTAGQIRFLSDQYDAGIRAADDRFGEFVEFLEGEGRLDDTILVVLSDHGEQFGEHGRVGHGHTLYREALEVPLLVHAPGLGPGVVAEPTGLVDVMPTLLELVGLETPAGVQGLSRLPAMLGSPPAATPPLFGELDRNARLRSVLQGDLHLVRNLEAGTAEAFDLARDPDEQTPLAPGDPVTEAGHVLDAHLETLPTAEPVQTVPLTAEQIEQLRALGYVD